MSNLTPMVTQPSGYQVRKYQCSPSMSVFWTHICSYQGVKNWHTNQELYIMVILDVKNDRGPIAKFPASFGQVLGKFWAIFKNCQKLSKNVEIVKMVKSNKNGKKLSKMVKYGQKLTKWSKWST